MPRFIRRSFKKLVLMIIAFLLLAIGFSYWPVSSRTLAVHLRRHALELIETQRSLTFLAEQHHRLGKHIQEVLDILELMNEDKPRLNDTPSKDNVAKSQKQEVCPEEYIGLQIGYPFFRKGFRRINCTDFVPIHQLVTIVVNIPEEPSRPAESYVEILKGIAKYYPKIRVVMVTKAEIGVSKMSSISKLNIDFKNELDSGSNEGTLWYDMVQQIKTPYVLIAPHITQFDDDIDLERLVRVLSYNPHVAIAGGSYRNLTGHWDIGCQQVSFRNWTATYKGGYYHSLNECVVCDFLPGPWMAKTTAVKDLEFDLYLKNGAFHDLFFRLKKSTSGELAVSCPDVMFNIKTHDVKDEDLVRFSNKHNMHKIVEPDGRVRWYGCRRGYPYTSAALCPQKNGITLSPSDMENLADAVKFFMRECEKAGAFCETQDGTLLGAVKFNGVLPWERDADIVFQTSNFSVLEKLQDKVAETGYKLSVESKEFSTFLGKPHGGKFHLHTTNWKIELWGSSTLESEMQISRGQHPTKVHFAGQWVKHPRNPGLYARNRYGREIYKHQQHWMTLRRKSSWDLYTPGKFPKCLVPGHSACLEQYPGDGNMQFSDYCP